MKNYEKTGILSLKDLTLPTDKQLKRGVAIIECVQEIPCDPCVAVCPVSAISMKDINDTPKIDYNKCTGCKRCVGICPGLAIFVIKFKDKKALITLPYELLPIPKVEDIVIALDREGKPRGKAKVIKVNISNKTNVVTIEVERNLAMEVRNIKLD
ncbi:MAG: (4Fe-4S)-binding protein [Thermoplasmatales archaeon SG8-52-3]|nr:MAG: (4Fe-4S)-binding protein [Thermoplasmatales archaeon SG8-52-3]